jgi:hypothetical protein
MTEIVHQQKKNKFNTYTFRQKEIFAKCWKKTVPSNINGTEETVLFVIPTCGGGITNLFLRHGIF